MPKCLYVACRLSRSGPCLIPGVFEKSGPGPATCPPATRALSPQCTPFFTLHRFALPRSRLLQPFSICQTAILSGTPPQWETFPDSVKPSAHRLGSTFTSLDWSVELQVVPSPTSSSPASTRRDLFQSILFLEDNSGVSTL